MFNPAKKFELSLYHVQRTNSIAKVNSVNPLQCKGNNSATSNNMKLVHWLYTSTVKRGLGEAAAHPGPSLLYKM